MAAPKGEIAHIDRGAHMATAWTGGLLSNPDTVLLHAMSSGRGYDMDVYTELLRDDQVWSCFEQRRRAVIQAEWFVDPVSESPLDQQIAAFVDEQLKAIAFDQITDQMLFATHYGYSVSEIMWGAKDGRTIINEIRVRDRKRFVFDREFRLRLLTLNHYAGEIMPDRKFWVHRVADTHTDNPYGLGLGHALYWPVFFKRNGIKFWMIYLEKYGMPTAAIKMPSAALSSAEERRKALDIIESIQVDAGVAIPDTLAVELIEASRSGTADYSALSERMDMAIAKVILSQTMTNSNGSSRAQATVHKDVRDEVIKADADMICQSFNSQVIKWLVEYNWPGATPPKVWRRTEQPEDLLQRAERDNKIINLGYEPTDEYIADTYGPGWQRRQAPPMPTQRPDEQIGPEFSEISWLTQQRAGHRADQQRIVDAAEYLATKYKQLYGHRIEQLMGYLDETKDVETFRERVTDMMRDIPAEQAVETIKRATFVSRLMGMLRGER